MCSEAWCQIAWQGARGQGELEDCREEPGGWGWGAADGDGDEADKYAGARSQRPLCVFLEKVSVLINNLETQNVYGNHINLRIKKKKHEMSP